MTDPTFEDISPSPRQLKIDELSKIITTLQLTDGCKTGICSKKINVDFCSGGAICTSGIAGVAQTEAP